MPRILIGLTALLLTTLGLSAPGASPARAAGPAATTACLAQEIDFIAVRGSGETSTDHSGFGATLWDLTQKATADVKVAGTNVPITQHEINYPAVGVGYGGWAKYPINYSNSETAGYTALYNYVMSIANGPCGYNWAANNGSGGHRFVLVGYSQGAEVVGDVMMALPPIVVSRMVAAVVLIADPRFTGSQSSVNVGDYNPGNNGISTPVAGLRTWKSPSLVHSYCMAHDPVCNLAASNIALCMKYAASCPHIHYVDHFLSGKLTWTAVAAQWAAQMALVGICGQPPTAPLSFDLIHPDGC